MSRFTLLTMIAGLFAGSPALAQMQSPPPALIVKPLASMKIAAVPRGPLFWRLE